MALYQVMIGIYTVPIKLISAENKKDKIEAGDERIK